MIKIIETDEEKQRDCIRIMCEVVRKATRQNVINNIIEELMNNKQFEAATLVRSMK
jgi:hypothetical protein